MDAYQRNALNYNKGRKLISFDVGDVVWRKSFVQSNAPAYFSAKLTPKFIKCEIIEKISDNVYVLKDLDKRTSGR